MPRSAFWGTQMPKVVAPTPKLSKMPMKKKQIKEKGNGKIKIGFGTNNSPS